MDPNLKQELKEIIEINEDLQERMNSEGWLISYNKKSDMLLAGKEFPAGTFYYPVFDTGMLLRIDKEKKYTGLQLKTLRNLLKKILKSV